MSTLSKILEKKIVAIIRGADPKEVLHIANALQLGGISILEITLNSPEANAVIEFLVNKIGDQILVGAGTVLDAQSAECAIGSGAKFIISPNADMETIRMTKLNGAVSIPGAFTPNEILSAYNAGGEIIKVFPAILGPAYLRDIHAPLPHIPLMPTGGIHSENIRAFHNAGAVAFGIGNGLYEAGKKISDEYLKTLTARAKNLVSALNPNESLKL